MSIKQQIDADLKTALINQEKDKTTTLRGLKSVILNAEISQNKREQGLSDQELTSLLNSELKKRTESIELYRKGGNEDKAKNEEAEIVVIKQYLPEQMSQDELNKLVDEVISEVGNDKSNMGRIIGLVKQKSSGKAQGADIAATVKGKLNL